MEVTDKKEKKQKGLHLTPILLVINIILAIVLIALVSVYINKNEERLVDKEVGRRTEMVKIVSDQFGSYLLSQDFVVDGYAKYITDTEMSMDEAKEYLSHWSSFYNSIILADMEQKTAILIRQNDMTTVPFSQIQCLRDERFERLKISEGAEITATDVYKAEDGKTNLISLYRPLVIEGKKCLLMFESNVDLLESAGMHAEGFDTEQGILLDGNGKVISGYLPSLEDATGCDFFAFMKNLMVPVDVDAITSELSTSGFASIDISDGDGNLYMGIFKRIPSTDNWTYVYGVDRNKASVNDDVSRLAYIMYGFILAWVLCNLVIVFRYNKKYKNNIRLIEQQNEDLVRANVAKTAFVSNMSHEIRTPINAVLGMDEMILKEADDPTIRGYAADIQKAGKTLLGIINDVLDFSKIESGKLEIIPVDYSPMEMLKEIYLMIKYRTEAKFLGLDVRIDTNLPKLLYGDDIRIKQVIVNLLTNAVKYTNEGTVTLTVESRPIDENRTSLYVSVKDTGIGLKPEEMKNLFAEFQRLDKVKNRNIEGTGLGLPIVARLLEMMGTKLEVDSAYGVGSNFYFTLEQRISDATPIGYVDLNKHEEVIEKHEVKLFAPDARILVVDDTVINLKVVRGLLKESGIKIDTATSGAECLQKIVEDHYDIIFLDHKMPKMDGIETLHRLKETVGKNPETPVIALTANVVSGAREMYASEGFDDFLSKPVDSAHLESMIKKYLPEGLVKERVVSADDDLESKDVSTEAAPDTLINTSLGLSNCNTMAMYKEILRVFVSDASTLCGQLLGFLYAKDLTNYQILVHGMKSSARTIGAMDVADEAFELEKRSGAGDLDYVTDHTNDFLKNFMDVADAAKKLASS